MQVHELEAQGRGVGVTYRVRLSLLTHVYCSNDCSAPFPTYSFEEAVMSNGPNDILTHVLAHFILNLKPQTRNLR